MTPGPISEVPGFQRPEPEQEPPAPPSGPLISSVPGVVRDGPDAAPEPPTATTQPAPLPAVLPPPPPAQAIESPADNDNDNDNDEDVDATRLAPRDAALVLTWDDGTMLETTGKLVVGRDPATSDAEQPAALVDPSMSLSKTHARFTAGLSPTVEDLHSTNGVRIDRAGESVTVAPGAPVALRNGDQVVCGTRRANVEVRA